MKSIIINLIIFCTAQWSILKAQTITVTNTTDKQRQELVSIDASQLDIDVNKGVVVHDAFGIEQASQLTHDGMFLLMFMCDPVQPPLIPSRRDSPPRCVPGLTTTAAQNILLIKTY